MNRRSFLSGGLIGVAVAAASALAKASQPEGAIIPCKDSHVPDAGYLEAPAYGMALPDQLGMKVMVPCVKCGILFALTDRRDGGMIGIVARGSSYNSFKG